MKTIQLTQGKVAKVSDEWFEYLNQWKWYAVRRGNSLYAARNIPTVDGKRTLIYMHREIMDAQPGEEVDHINGDTLDNRKENLRLCTKTENMQNRGKQNNNTSGYKGVSWYKQRGKWQTQITVNGKHIFLGYYANPEDAARAYDVAARELHGDFAKTNFPETGAQNV